MVKKFKLMRMDEQVNIDSDKNYIMDRTPKFSPR